MDEKIKVKVKEKHIEYGEVEVTQGFLSELKEEVKKQKAKEVIKEISPKHITLVQDDWELPDGFEVFDEEE